MRRVAVFVDAGYFWVQAAHIVLGGRGQRNQLTVDYNKLRIELLARTKDQFPDANLLRVYWYDGPGPNGKSPDHQALEQLDDIKLRLGTRNGSGAQKAVDGLIIADMISLAQSKAITDAMLISGDADLTPGVIAAQNLGIRVHLLSMGPAAATSPYLRCEVDLKEHWNDNNVKQFVTPAKTTPPSTTKADTTSGMESAAPVKAATNKPTSTLKDAVQKTHAGIDPALLKTATPEGALPKAIDKKLLAEAMAILGRPLTETEKRQARVEFRKLL
jgi:uncharacterized LabA/DUF88 family protein